MPTIELPQGSISYEDTGSGRPVVFVHGFLVDGRLWRDVAPAVAEHARAIVPNLPLGAHTTPMRADADLSAPGVARLVADLLEALDLSDAILVGNDTGGAIVQLVLANHPERVGGVVLTSCDAFENFPPKLLKPLLAVPRIPGGLAALAQVLRLKPLWRTPVVFGWVAKRRLEDALMGSWVRPVRTDPGVRRDVGKLLSSVEPDTLNSAVPRMGAFPGPVVLCWAREDKLFPARDAERLAAVFGDARIDWVDDSYTFVPLDQPAAVIRSVRDVLARATREVSTATA